MALATRPKPTTSHKKRHAQHHRHSKTYIRAYWPYLPMLAIVGVGAVVNKVWYTVGTSASVAGLSPQLAATQSLTRVQALTGDQTGKVLGVVILVTFAAFVLFVLRHSRRLHRLVTRGEAFVSDHPTLDITTVFIFTVGIVLTRVIPT